MPSIAVTSRIRVAAVLFILLLAIAPATACKDVAAPLPQDIPPQVRISQVYMGAVDESSTYECNFVELFNASADSVTMTGWSLQSATSPGTFKVTNLPSLTIEAYRYLLVRGVCWVEPQTFPDYDVAGRGLTAGPSIGRVALVANQVAIVNNTDADIVDYVGYGSNDSIDYEGSGPAPATSYTTAAARKDGGCKDTNDNAADFEIIAPSPRNSSFPAHTCPEPEPDACGDPANRIHAIQGSAAGSPSAGLTRTVEGIVVGDFQGASGLSGFFVQEEVDDIDADPSTSEALFVAEGPSSTLDVAAGDLVRVTGVVAEVDGLTTLGEVTSLKACGSTDLPPATDVTLPSPTTATWEQCEGMLVTIPRPLTVSETGELAQFGQVRLVQGDRPWHFTELNDPDASGFAAFRQEVALRSITLDDGSLLEHPDPIMHPHPGLSASHTLRAGDTLPAGLTGVVDQFAEGYRIQPLGPVGFTPSNPRQETNPVLSGANIRVAGANLGNYFNGDESGGFSGSPGASTAAEFTRQRDKLIAALLALDADILGVTRIENDPYGDASALADLVRGLNAASEPDAFAAIDPGTGITWGGAATTVGIIYRSDRVVPIAAPQKPTTDAFAEPSLAGYVPMAQTFEEANWGERFTVVVSDLPARDNCPSDGPDADQGDGQGCWNALRTEAAAALVTWLDSDPTGSRDPDFLWIGDANAFAHEDPIVTIVSGGYTDLISTAAGHAYTVVWDGLSGASDRALASTALVPQVTGVEPWHNNADEPAALDYNEEDKTESQRISLYDTNPYRAASHDPVLVGLRLVPDLSDLEGSYGLAWHTGQGDLRLGTLWGSQGEDGPDSNDGVVLGESSWSDGDGEVSVTVTGASGQYACLHAWLDYTGSEPPEGLVHAPDGLWSPDEEVISGLPLLSGTDQLVTFAIPSGAIDVAAAYNMRFRLVPAPDPSAPACTSPSQLLATDEPLKPTGRADGGEVEDHTFKAGPLAVRIAALDAIPTPGGILITWETVSEHDNAGFNLYRAAASGGPWKKLNETLIPAASPGSSEGHAYRWLDSSADPVMMHYYLLEDVALDGSRTRHTPVEVIPARPNAVRLSTLSGTSILPLVLTALVILSILGGLPPALWAIHDRRMHGHRHPGRDAVEGREHLAARLRKMPHR
mgnify:FL=1